MFKYNAKVLKVIDGDTIDILLDLGFGISYKQRIRFYDYDAPETFRPKSEKERTLGLKAKEFLKEKILGENIIISTIKDKRGKYGRILGIIYHDDICINDLMKEEGFIKE